MVGRSTKLIFKGDGGQVSRDESLLMDPNDSHSNAST